METSQAWLVSSIVHRTRTFCSQFGLLSKQCPHNAEHLFTIYEHEHLVHHERKACILNCEQLLELTNTILRTSLCVRSEHQVIWSCLRTRKVVREHPNTVQQTARISSFFRQASSEHIFHRASFFADKFLSLPLFSSCCLGYLGGHLLNAAPH